jgi:hypothetical protein
LELARFDTTRNDFGRTLTSMVLPDQWDSPSVCIQLALLAPFAGRGIDYETNVHRGIIGYFELLSMGPGVQSHIDSAFLGRAVLRRRRGLRFVTIP